MEPLPLPPAVVSPAEPSPLDKILSLFGLSLKYNLRFLGGNVLLSRSAINTESLSGDDDRSGDSGDERGGVNKVSVPANAASTRLTKSLEFSDGLVKKKNKLK